MVPIYSLDEAANDYSVQAVNTIGEEFMAKHKKLIKWLIRILAVLSLLKILSVILILVGVYFFPRSNYKMYLPWNKIKAVQYAQNYYQQHYEKKFGIPI